MTNTKQTKNDPRLIPQLDPSREIIEKFDTMAALLMAPALTEPYEGSDLLMAQKLIRNNINDLKSPAWDERDIAYSLLAECALAAKRICYAKFGYDNKTADTLMPATLQEIKTMEKRYIECYYNGSGLPEKMLDDPFFFAEAVKGVLSAVAKNEDQDLGSKYPGYVNSYFSGLSNKLDYAAEHAEKILSREKSSLKRVTDSYKCLKYVK